MPHKVSRNAHAPIRPVSDLAEIDQNSGHRKSKRHQPRLGQSSNSHIEKPIPTNSPPGREGGLASGDASSDDDANGDVGNADAADPDDESDEDGKGDAFAPSDRAIEEHGDQAGHLTGDISDHGSTNVGKQSLASGAFKRSSTIAKARCSVGDSDDDVYNGVDLISNSEQDESNVERIEERNIIESEEADIFNTAPSKFEASDEWGGFEIDNDIQFFDEQYHRTDSKNFASEMEFFQSVSIFDKGPAPPTPSPSPRRVHFKEPISQMSTDSDIDSDSGDINVLFSRDPTSALSSSEDFCLGGPYVDHKSDHGSSVGSSSGYETDYGDTTDEEDVPASATKRPQSLLRQPSLSSLEFDVQDPAMPEIERPSSFARNPTGYRRGPRMGTWIVDSTKLRGVMDSVSGHVNIRSATRANESNNLGTSTASCITAAVNASPMVLQQTLGTAPDGSDIDVVGFSNQASLYQYNDPVLAPESDMVAASVSLSTDRNRQASMDHLFDASSVFLPMDAMGDFGDFSENEYMNDDDDDDEKDDADDDYALLNIDDFIDFGDDSSEDGDQAAGDNATLTLPVKTEGSEPKTSKTPSPDASDNLMKHLDINRHIVSAFRRGQPHHQTQPRPRHSNLALNSYAFKGGRQAAANASVAQKKRKMSGSFGHRPSFGIPPAKRRTIHHR